MIDFHSEADFVLENKAKYSDWITRVIQSEHCSVGDIDYIFCGDNQLLEINKEYLHHDTLTDIITFDYSESKRISGDIFISTERVTDNANLYGVDFNEELLRVMCHGILHLVGYSDKSKDEKQKMRQKEDEKIKMFHVEL